MDVVSLHVIVYHRVHFGFRVAAHLDRDEGGHGLPPLLAEKGEWVIGLGFWPHLYLQLVNVFETADADDVHDISRGQDHRVGQIRSGTDRALYIIFNFISKQAKNLVPIIDFVSTCIMLLNNNCYRQ